MNVLIAVPWDQEVGGVANVVGHLGRHLTDQEHGVLYCYPDENVRPHSDRSRWGFPCYRLRLRAPDLDRREALWLNARRAVAFLLFLPVTLFFLVRIARQHEIDVINVHYPLPHALHYLLAARLLGLPLVVSTHGADLFPGGSPKERYSAALRFVLRRADAVTCPSKAFAARVEALFPDLADRITHVHNGIDPTEFPSASAVLERRNESDEFALVSIAMLNRKKAVDVLLRAATILAEDGVEFRLRLAGEGPLRNELERLSERLSIDDRVDFLGMLDRSEVIDLLLGCDVFVLPSRAEPFGIVLAEAMMAGRPVVATRVGGIPEVVDDGETGFLVEPDDPAELADALGRLAANPRLRRELGEAGRRRAETHFTTSHTGEGYERLYADLVVP